MIRGDGDSDNVIYLPILPPRPRTCFDCDHMGVAAHGTSWCLLFDEQIDSELYAAKDCNGFEEVRD